MDEFDLKEVNFKKYCEICKNKEKKEYEPPCDECLEVGMREGTEKPEFYEEKVIYDTKRKSNSRRTG